VTIYPLAARGTAGTGGRTLAAASVALGNLSMSGETGEEGLDTLAKATGGLPLRHTDNFAAAMASIASDTSTYYVLAYSTDNTVLDGRYRPIEVKTSWKGLTVRARRGYVATPLPRPRAIRTGG
jgi:VWFA-related protein